MVGIFLGIGAFLGIMIPTLLVSSMSGLTIKILELLKVYKHGTLTAETNTYITGAGYYRQGKTYILRDGNNSGRFESGRVFGYMILIFIPLVLLISLVVYLLVSIL